MKGNLIWFLIGGCVAYVLCKSRNERKLEDLKAKTVSNASLKELLTACKDRVKEFTSSGLQDLLEKVDDLAETKGGEE
ncbi:MAG: hypothetical protein NC324_02330 [Bacteroides sp.]|nr:hypothetical protein [Bacteroides sp.]